MTGMLKKPVAAAGEAAAKNCLIFKGYHSCHVNRRSRVESPCYHALSPRVIIVYRHDSRSGIHTLLERRTNALCQVSLVSYLLSLFSAINMSLESG